MSYGGNVYSPNTVYYPVTTMATEKSARRSTWPATSLYATSFLQMGIGVSVIVVQAVINNKVQKRTDWNQIFETITGTNQGLENQMFNFYAFILGSLIAFVGLLCVLVVICKPTNCFCLTVFSVLLSAVGVGASLACIGASVYYINQIESKNYGSIFLNLVAHLQSAIEQQLGLALDGVKTELIAIASLGGVNVAVVLIASALFCRAGFACCRPDA